ncbi:GNAT family N-acetyltransferase [Kordiimonas sp.]|uniref:GNAT family N-acetyltransferase n=1 Tax=Kordiimonas sp. TaxID=1970157 RepID=UPI003A92D008
MTEILPIKTDRLIIRAFREDDAVAFYDWRNDAEVARYTLWDFPYPMERALALARKMATAVPFAEGQSYHLIIEEAATGAPVGHVGIGNGKPSPGTARLSYSLSRAAQGKGYMTEALRGILPALIQPFGIHTFATDIDVRNPASGRVLERLGFRAGPVHKQRTLVRGEWCDEIDYEVSAAELLAHVSQ